MNKTKKIVLISCLIVSGIMGMATNVYSSKDSDDDGKRTPLRFKGRAGTPAKGRAGTPGLTGTPLNKDGTPNIKRFKTVALTGLKNNLIENFDAFQDAMVQTLTEMAHAGLEALKDDEGYPDTLQAAVDQDLDDEFKPKDAGTQMKTLFESLPGVNAHRNLQATFANIGLALDLDSYPKKTTAAKGQSAKDRGITLDALKAFYGDLLDIRLSILQKALEDAQPAAEFDEEGEDEVHGSKGGSADEDDLDFSGFLNSPPLVTLQDKALDAAKVQIEELTGDLDDAKALYQSAIADTERQVNEEKARRRAAVEALNGEKEVLEKKIAVLTDDQSLLQAMLTVFGFDPTNYGALRAQLDSPAPDAALIKAMFPSAATDEQDAAFIEQVIVQYLALKAPR